ncbi:MAG: PfkB family carbohydrate kinase [Gemmatimonadales bacterium]
MTDILAPLSRDRLLEILGAMRNVQVAVVGDVMLDRYLIGDADRVSPEAPVPVVTMESEVAVPGGAGNVAANIAALGASAALVAVVGEDSAGDALRETLVALTVDTSGMLTIPGRPTTTKTRIVAQGQQIVRIDREVTNPVPDRHRDDLHAAAHLAIAEADVVVVEDYDKGAIDAGFARALVDSATEQGVPIVVDPKRRHFFDYAGATVFKPNRRELEAAFGTHFMGDDADLAAARERLAVDHMLLTLGADGMALISAGDALRRTPSNAREVFDVSGAGDTVTAWLGAALGTGAEIGEAAWLANLAAGVKVGKRGTATVSPDEILQAWDETVGDK